MRKKRKPAMPSLFNQRMNLFRFSVMVQFCHSEIKILKYRLALPVGQAVFAGSIVGLPSERKYRSHHPEDIHRDLEHTSSKILWDTQSTTKIIITL
jgi:hypothetical protein